MKHELANPHVHVLFVEVQLEGLDIGGLALPQQTEEGHPGGTILHVVFPIPDSDGQVLLSEILGELLVLFGFSGLERVNLERNGETPVQDLLDGRLA